MMLRRTALVSKGICPECNAELFFHIGPEVVCSVCGAEITPDKIITVDLDLYHKEW